MKKTRCSQFSGLDLKDAPLTQHPFPQISVTLFAVQNKSWSILALCMTRGVGGGQEILFFSFFLSESPKYQVRFVGETL